MKKSKMTSRGILFTVGISSIALAAACGTEESSGGNTSGEASEELEESKLITNWFAQPEHGGNYAALQEGMYEEQGLDMEVEPGGPEVSSEQIVASGDADFGYTSGEDLLIARNEGIPLVAIGAIFQKSPYVLISHEGQVKDFEDLEGKTVYTATGVGYWEYIKEEYGIENVEERAYTGTLTEFVDNEDAVTQGYVTSEPYSLEEQGVDIDYQYVSDSGFESYGNVIFTTEDMIENNPEKVQAFMNATVEGWEYYRENYEEVNPFLKEQNPDLSEEKMEYSVEAQEELIFGGEAEENGFGYMNSGNWEKLQSDLNNLGIISNEESSEEIFTTEFLEEAQNE
ncbi:ABC transporter substrate-binding protein [Marinococcus sp. PL1-022]|uniref:ABC transporter substrate-binding protein n=1 Tax=Marinococcus sp. PL1-022 TaxID=3095363 RepID=UPI0029C2B17D|nr:ABC transporter substrate-binding protein [Marinococcus sp. PL1-022]MDX6153492.1 ABC transporter substrate-binding protein [Marinococcus sp. PL1-022]